MNMRLSPLIPALICLLSFVLADPPAQQPMPLEGPVMIGDMTESSSLDANPSLSSAVSPDPSTVPPSKAASAKPLVMAYYPGWMTWSYPVAKVDFTRFDWIDFAFAVPTESGGVAWEDPEQDPSTLTALVKVAHRAGAKVKVSVGGWTGSKYFSTAVRTPESRKKFASELVQLHSKYSLDGIDIDWEYPGQVGSGNIYDPTDTENYLAFLRLLKSSLPQGALLTAAVEPRTFQDKNAQPLRDVRPFAEVFDWIMIMNYDVWGASDMPGPNAPLYDRCHSSTQPDASAVGAFNSWTSAGFPPDKIVLGLPVYGYVSHSSATKLRSRESGPSVKSLPNEGGQIQFRDIVGNGALVRSAADRTVFEGANGFVRYWDECSSTPYLRSAAAVQVVTYDDAESLELKAEFARAMGMKGVNMFAIGGDTEEWDLVDAVRRVLGY